MSEINNLSDIKESFDTIKSLLNSIRAQDVLNTGDMTKLLASMNGKLDKLNQEENLDLMNSVLSTIKQSLDERHSVLISKFSTIESLFSNILKNSVDSLKSSEIKELFDIIATNLSVFSREVVSQKDTLTDIILRIEALRSDDASSALMVSNFDALKRDLERFNNGFESIIVNLNDNFGSIVRALEDVRERVADNHYDKDFENLYMTSNSLLSSVQALDKKSVQFEETLAAILAKCESKVADERLSELFLQNKEIYNSIGELAVNCNVEPLYQKIDNASALINGLKEILQNVDTDTTSEYIARLTKMETAITRILDENDFRKVRNDLEGALNQIANSVNLSQNDLYVVKNDLETVASSIKALDIHVNFQNIQSSLTKSEVNIKTYISDLSNKFSQLSDLTFQRTVEDIKQKLDTLNDEIKSTAGANLETLAGSLIGLKSAIGDIEASTGAANSALFKSVSERLAALENTLAGLLNAQAMSVSGTGRQVSELTGAVNLKLDSAQVEIAATKDSVEDLKSRLENLVNTDFAAVMSDVKVGIISSQTDVISALKETLIQDDTQLLEVVNSKFEAAKLQADECSRNLTVIYKDGLSELRSLLNSITSTLIDIVSYVSATDKKDSSVEFEKRFTDIEYAVKDYAFDSIEKINAFIKESLDKINTKLTNYDATNQSHFQNLASKIENNSSYIREDIKSAYESLESIKKDIIEFKEYVIADLNNNPVKAEVVDRIAGLKNFLTEKLNAFETEFTRNGLEKFSELQELNSKIMQKIEGIPEANRSVLVDVRNELVNGIKNSLDVCVDRAIEDIRTFVEVSTSAQGIELESFKADCNNLLSDLKKQVPNLAEEINLDDKLEVVQEKICSTVSKELERTSSLIAALVTPDKPASVDTKELERAISDLLIKQEDKLKSELADKFEYFEVKLAEVGLNSSSSKATVVNKLNELEAGISKSLEKNELAQAEISEKLEVFGNTLYKLVGNGGATVNQAFEKIDELAKIVAEKSGAKLPGLEILADKIESLASDVSAILANETNIKTAEMLAELLEKSAKLSSDVAALALKDNTEEDAKVASLIEKNSASLFSGLQQLSSSNAKYAAEINDSLALIQSELVGTSAKSNVQEEIINEVLAIRNSLDSQISEVDRLYGLCSDIAENVKSDDISKILVDFKTEIITQVITIFNQISFSSEQEEIMNFIKAQQDELKNSVRQLATSVDRDSSSCDKIVAEIDARSAKLSDRVTAALETANKANAEIVEGINKNLGTVTEEINAARNEIKALTGEGSAYNFLSVENDIAKLRLAVGYLREKAVAPEKVEEVLLSLTNLSNTVNELRSELPTETVEYLRAQVDKLIEGVKLNDAIASNIVAIKDRIEVIDKERNAFREDVESLINKAVATLDNISDAQGLKDYIASGFDGLYNSIAQKIDISGANAETAALITTVIAKQDASLAHLMARMDLINNADVIGLVGEMKSEIVTQLLSVFNQISFEAETVEIRSDIADAKDEINAEIKKVSDDIARIISTQSEFVDDYTNSFNRLEETLENNHVFQLKAISEIAVSNKEIVEKVENNHIYELKAISEVAEGNKGLAETLEEVKAQIKAIQESEDDESHYSLTDVEADLAKLRLVLSDLKANQNKKEFENVLSSLDVVINQIQDLKDFIPADKIDDINENTIEVLDLLEGLALDLKNVHSTQDDIIGTIRDSESVVNREIREEVDGVRTDLKMTLEDFANEIKEFSKDTFSAKLAEVKNEIFTHLLAVINQISFVEEQEEIISNIDEVKAELKEVHSHINDVQAQLSIMSSGATDEMSSYSLLDIETDVAKLRVTLEEIKAEGRGEEVDGLVQALAQASDTLEYLKTEIPNHEISEVRAELEKIANDIISISIRTNKLLISSDESYKNLKDHMETFQSIIGDVDERTKNLYEEVGMDKIESQVTSIRDIVGRQELTNQVFNEVFEYLAEWIDSTGEKIGYITDKLNNTEDINEIKLSLEDLRNSTSVKFEIDAQSEKIDAMEAKLNVIIESLEPTFQNHQERMQTLERKINRIVDFFEPAFTKQQERINKLEGMLDKILDVVSSDNGYGDALSRLDRISDIVTSKDDAQLVKKLTSFEKQITKLNKSVEKLTTYANEK